ncbi:unnamed protein product [Sordaria macrospora k-hell]|uniref:WGS project CABT00000000 data, contig 2.30 n=1 Tax=Sordaria macrospora (strain ATCC MYA-333 / DSM 997 / K(L3346) / K-hell) TaxID=771870 RepID=F7W5B9_SORMK|nr:uncharacterized protein SMAC_05667 [Sordaria macrospora k-hell]CCC12707.1 unnamed protein product [Sordaria macrospora k-hell]
MVIPSGQQIPNMAFNFHGWAVAIPEEVDGYEVIKLMTRAPSTLPLTMAISNRNLQTMQDLQLTDQEQQSRSDPTKGIDEVLLVGFTVADLPDAAKKEYAREYCGDIAVGTVVTPDRTITVNHDNRLILVVTPFGGLDGEMKFYGLVYQQNEAGLYTPYIVDQDSCLYLPIFRGGIESASARKGPKEWNQNTRDIVGGRGQLEVSHAVAVSASDSDRAGQASPKVTSGATDDDEREVSPDPFCVNTPSLRRSSSPNNLERLHTQTQAQSLTAKFIPLLHDVIRVEKTLKEVITAADKALTSSLAEISSGSGEVHHPHSDKEIRERSASALLAGGFDKMYRDLVQMTKVKRLHDDQRVVNTIRQIVDTTLTPLVSRLREMERLMAPEEGIGSANGTSEHDGRDDGLDEDINEGNEDLKNDAFANNTDPDGTPEGNQTDKWKKASRWRTYKKWMAEKREDPEFEENKDTEDGKENEDSQETNGHEKDD